MSALIKRGWHFLQIPGPSNTPERIRKAMSKPTIDHRGPAFSVLARSILDRLKLIFQTKGNVIIYPSSGTGAWEASLMNLFNPGDKVLVFETGHFANKWKEVAEKIGLLVDWVEGDWRHGVDPQQVLEKLQDDQGTLIKGVMAVHNETSNGVTSNLKAIREAIDQANHPALFLVDVVSSLGATDFRQDEWGVDVAISASQKGLMLPPGLGFNSINHKALEASRQVKTLNSYWGWERFLEFNERGFFPYTPASGLLFGLEESLDMLLEEGLPQVFKRHKLYAGACRRAAETWGFENQCLDPNAYSDAVTALRVPEGVDADQLRKMILLRFNMSLGTGLGKLKGKVFRIGHLGDFNELMLMATLSGVEMGLALSGIPFQRGGVQAAVQFITESLDFTTENKSL